MTRARWALVALGVGLVVLGLDALVRTKAQGYGRPVFHPAGARPTPPPDRSWANTDPPTPTRASPFHPGGHVHAPWEQAEGLGVCQQCGNLPDTPGHELGCPAAQLRPEDFTP